MDNDKYKPQELWNMATETLKRLSRNLDACSYFAQRGDLIGWSKATMGLRRDISSFLTPEEFKEIDDILNKIPKDWMMGNKVRPSRYAEVHKIFDDFYMKVTWHMKEKGLLMPKAKDPRNAVMNM